MCDDTALLWRKAVGEGDVKSIECAHLPVEPLQCIRPPAISPTYTGPKSPDADFLQPSYGGVESWIFKMEPLADSKM
jgi:hypothetical protein